MGNKILQNLRGPESRLPVLLDAQIALTTDTGKTFIGHAGENIELAKQADLVENSRLLGLKGNAADISNSLALKVDTVPGKGLSTNDYSTIEKAEVAKVITKANISYVDTKVGAMASGTPKVIVQSVANLPAASEVDRLALVLDNGHLYYSNGTVWGDGGAFVPAPDTFLQRKTMLSSVDDLDLTTDLGIYYINSTSKPINWPIDAGAGILCVFKQSNTASTSGFAQVIYETVGTIRMRFKTSTGFSKFVEMANAADCLQRKTAFNPTDILDNFLELGVYHTDNATIPIGWPSATGGVLCVFRQSTSPSLTGIVQVVYDNNGAIFSRYRTSTSFTAFVKMATTIDVNKCLQIKTILNSANDINDVLQLGIYQIVSTSKPLNWPTTYGGTLVVLKQGVEATTYGLIQTVYATNGDIWSRYKTSSGFGVFKLANDYGHPIDYDYVKLRNSINKMFIPFTTEYAMPYMVKGGVAGSYPVDTVVKALPYSSVFYAGNDILYNKTISTFYSAVLNPASILYTNFGGTGAGNRATVYGVVCSTVVGWLSGLDIYYITSEMKNILDFYLYTDSCDVKVGDAMLSTGHVKLVSDILFNSDGSIYKIEITEAWMPLTRKILYTVASFEAQLQQYGGAFRLGRFPNFKARTLPKIEYATDCIPNYGDKSIYKNGEHVWLYVANASTSIYYKKSTDTEFINIALSALTSQIVNDVTVYDITDLLSSVGTWNVTTNTTNKVKTTILICKTGVVTVVGNSFSMSGYSDNITPLWYQVMLLATGTPNPYYYPAPEGYSAGTVQGTKKMIENVSGESFTIPDADGYYIRAHYQTPYGQTFKDSNVIIIGGGSGGDGDPYDGGEIGGDSDPDPIVD